MSDGHRTLPKALGGILAIGLIVYGNAVFHPFVHDDLVFIRHNPRIARLDDWPDIFLRFSAPVEGVTITNPYYRPLLELFTRLQYRLFGFHASTYHFFNILVHAANAALIFLILSRILELMGPVSRRDAPSSSVPSASIPWWTALFFLVHPVQSEAVACIAGLSNLMFASFCLGGLYLYLNTRGTGPRPYRRSVYLSGAWLCYLSALFVKAQAVMLPFLVLAVEVLVLIPAGKKKGRPGTAVRQAWAGVGGFAAVTLLYLCWRKLILGGMTTAVLEYKQELFLRLAAIPQTLLMYGRILVLPTGLHYFRSVNVLEPAGWAPVLLTLGAAAAVMILRWLPQEKRRIAGFGLSWFFLSLLPVLNIIPLIQEYSWIAAFEHFLYLPAAGFFLFAVVAGEHAWRVLSKGRARTAGLVLTVLLAAGLGGVTIWQNRFWSGEIPLFERAVLYEPELGRLRFLLGRAYYFDGSYDQSIAELDRALSIMEDYRARTRSSKAVGFYEYFIKDIEFVLAHDYEKKGEYARAVASYGRALRIDPRDAGLHRNTGIDYLRLKDCGRAAVHFQAAIRIDPRDRASMNNLAVCLMKQGKRDQAERLLRRALAIDPGFISARQNLEKLLQSPGANR